MKIKTHLLKLKYVIVFALLSSIIIFCANHIVANKVQEACKRCVRPKYKKLINLFKTYLQPYCLEHDIVKTSDNHKLSVMLVPSNFIKPKGTIIFCHGRWQSKEFLYKYCELFKNYNLIFFDFRAHGESTGDIVSFGTNEYEDVKAIFEYTKNRFPELDIFAIGLSMGASTLIHAAYRNIPFKKMVLDSPFESLKEQLERSFSKHLKLPKILKNFALRAFKAFIKNDIYEFEPRSMIENINIPTMFIHALDDKTVDVNASLEMFSLCQAPSRIWILEKSGHVKAYKNFSEKYAQEVMRFFD